MTVILHCPACGAPGHDLRDRKVSDDCVIAYWEAWLAANFSKQASEAKDEPKESEQCPS